MKNHKKINCNFCGKLITMQKNNTYYSQWFEFPEKYGILPHMAKTVKGRYIYVYCSDCNSKTKIMEREDR